MYTKPVNLLMIGDVLAEDIMIGDKVLFTADTILTLDAILKLQSLEVQYVKVSSSPYVTSKKHNWTNYITDLIEMEFYDFLIKNNKNYRYSIFIKNHDDLQLLTKIAFHNLNENVTNLLSALKSWDIFALKHVIDVFIITAHWMQSLGMPPSTEDCYGLLLHDIGKLKIPRPILLKKERLNKEEFEIIKMHTEYGADILKHLQFPEIVCEMAKYHHIRLNQTGYPAHYPNNLDIRIKMLMIVNVFSALTLDRPYRKAYSFQDGLSILQREKDGFDSELIIQFIDFIDQKIETIPQR